MDIKKKELINEPRSIYVRPHGIVFAMPREWRPPTCWCRVGTILGEKVPGEPNIDQTSSVPRGYDVVFRFFNEMVTE